MRLHYLLIIIFVIGALAIGFQHVRGSGLKEKEHQEWAGMKKMKIDNLRTATFAGGCFWCVEKDFEQVEGVISVISGYTGGHEENPTYEAVSAGGTGHVEAVQVLYDPEKVSFKELLNVFWRHVDPTDPGGQFVDRGHSIAPPYFIMMKSKDVWRTNQKVNWRKPGCLINLW